MSSERELVPGRAVRGEVGDGAGGSPRCPPPRPSWRLWCPRRGTTTAAAAAACTFRSNNLVVDEDVIVCGAPPGRCHPGSVVSAAASSSKVVVDFVVEVGVRPDAAARAVAAAAARETRCYAGNGRWSGRKPACRYLCKRRLSGHHSVLFALFSHLQLQRRKLLGGVPDVGACLGEVRSQVTHLFLQPARLLRLFGLWGRR